MTAPLERECRHGMTPEFCADCTGRDGGQKTTAARRQRLVDHYGWATAKYPGRCAGCGEPYAPGEPIAMDIYIDGWFASCCDQEDR